VLDLEDAHTTVAGLLHGINHRLVLTSRIEILLSDSFDARIVSDELLEFLYFPPILANFYIVVLC